MLKRMILLLFLTSYIFAGEDGKVVPTIDALLTIRSVGSVKISPNGRWIAYTISQANFEENAYISQIWLANAKSGQSLQLTRGKKSASNPQWSPDSKWLTFTSSRGEDKSQIFAISPVGGEAIKLTKVESGISNYQWSPDGQKIAFTTMEPESKALKDRKEHVGDYFVVRKEYRHNHIWLFEVTEAMKNPQTGDQITSGKEFNVGDFSWSHDGTRIAFHATLNPDRIQFYTADVYVYSLDDSTTTKIVSMAGPDWSPQWSPDDSQILFSSYSGKELFYGFNSNLVLVQAKGGARKILTSEFDENPGFVHWNRNGVFFRASQKTSYHLFQLNPGNGKIKRLTGPDDLIASTFSLTPDGKKMAFTASSPTTLREIYVSDVQNFSPKRITKMTEQTKEFVLGTRELISWQSKDSTIIEGVLIKPANFDNSRKYPLLCVIHGGPTGIDRPALLAKGTRYYPVDIWAGRGALILMVNYRGSAGYGEKFRRLNYRNLGVGDAWDVVSGVDNLIDKGWVDAEKVGCMGWSQGGYISAFLTTSSDRFAAISVGAGISNWATYYYNTDITPFTINYLGDDPVDDAEVYQKTSPMSYIKNARTPTLIQHGEFDKRVPTPNAYELRQGLEDRGIPVEMVIYKGFGHGISKPKSQRVVMWHNLKWFNHYLWNDDLPDLSKPELPEKVKEKDAEKDKT